MISLFVMALSNMERLAEADRKRNFSAAEGIGRLCLVAGYVGRRIRAREKREVADTTAPPRAA